MSRTIIEKGKVLPKKGYVSSSGTVVHLRRNCHHLDYSENIQEVNVMYARKQGYDFCVHCDLE